MSYVREITPSYLQNRHILRNVLSPEGSFSYKAVFYNRTLNKKKTIQEHAWDIKHLAIKAYPGYNLKFLEHVIVQKFIEGFGITA